LLICYQFLAWYGWSPPTQSSPPHAIPTTATYYDEDLPDTERNDRTHTQASFYFIQASNIAQEGQVQCSHTWRVKNLGKT